MNFFEEEIAKYERRLKRIEANPSTKMVSSNKLYYQAMLQDNVEQLKWWKEGKPFLAGLGIGLAELMRSFGEFRVLPMVAIADRLAPKRAEECFDRIRAMGLPDYACDRTILFLPMALAGDDLPRPKFIFNRTGACEIVHNTYRTLSKLMGVPMIDIDIPFEDPHQEHLQYVVDQLKAVITYVEANLPGAKYDEAKMVEWQALTRRWYAALHDIYELRKHVPCPDHPRDVFRGQHAPADYASAPMLVKYYETYRDELQERVARNFSPVGEEKLRIIWGITGPYGSNIWDYLAGRGVSVPFWHYGQAYRNFAMPFIGDETEFGRKLNPLEEAAREMIYNSWAGSGERWIRDTIVTCREFRADGFVQFEQTGCEPVLGIGQIVGEHLEKELGIPSWRVEGRQLLGRTERSSAEFMAGLEAFIDLCFERKKGR